MFVAVESFWVRIKRTDSKVDFVGVYCWLGIQRKMAQMGYSIDNEGYSLNYLPPF